MHLPTRARFLILFLASILVCGAARALPASQQSSTPASQSAPAAATSQPDSQQPVPVRPAPVQPTQAYALPPAILAKAITLPRLRAILDFGGTAWTILVLLVVLAWRWPVALRNWAERI